MPERESHRRMRVHARARIPIRTVRFAYACARRSRVQRLAKGAP